MTHPGIFVALDDDTLDWVERNVARRGSSVTAFIRGCIMFARRLSFVPPEATLNYRQQRAFAAAGGPPSGTVGGSITFVVVEGPGRPGDYIIGTDGRYYPVDKPLVSTSLHTGLFLRKVT